MAIRIFGTCSELGHFRGLRGPVRCLLWVISGHEVVNSRCLLYPPKRTWCRYLPMSAKCQSRPEGCRRIHFRWMPSENDGPSELPDSGLAVTSLSAGSPTSRITVRRPRAFCSFSRFALGLSLAFCLCGSLYLRDPGSFALCLLGHFALDPAGGFTLRL